MFVYEQAFRYFGDRVVEKNEAHVRVRTVISLFWRPIGLSFIRGTETYV
jgi:hypothetical protein